MRKALLTLSAAAALVLTSTSPAWANISKSGTIYCAGYATARAEYFDTLYLLGPGDSAYTTFYSIQWRVASNLGNPDGYWRANAVQGLNTSRTYAYCNSGG